MGFSPTLNWLALEEIVRIKKQDYLTLLLETSTSDFLLIATGAATEPELQATDIHVLLKFPPQSSEFKRVSFSTGDLLMASLLQLIIYFPPYALFYCLPSPLHC
jgi:hypothetical protein